MRANSSISTPRVPERGRLLDNCPPPGLVLRMNEAEHGECQHHTDDQEHHHHGLRLGLEGFVHALHLLPRFQTVPQLVVDVLHVEPFALGRVVHLLASVLLAWVVLGPCEGLGELAGRFTFCLVFLFRYCLVGSRVVCGS